MSITILSVLVAIWVRVAIFEKLQATGVRGEIAKAPTH